MEAQGMAETLTRLRTQLKAFFEVLKQEKDSGITPQA